MRQGTREVTTPGLPSWRADSVLSARQELSSLAF